MTILSCFWVKAKKVNFWPFLAIFGQFWSLNLLIKRWCTQNIIVFLYLGKFFWSKRLFFDLFDLFKMFLAMGQKFRFLAIFWLFLRPSLWKSLRYFLGSKFFFSPNPKISIRNSCKDLNPIFEAFLGQKVKIFFPTPQGSL